MALLDSLGDKKLAFADMSPEACLAVVETLVFLVLAEQGDNDPHAELFALALVELPTLCDMTDEQRADLTRQAMARLESIEATGLYAHLVKLAADIGTQERRLICVGLASVVAAAGGTLGEARKTVLMRMGETYGVSGEQLTEVIQAIAGEPA